MKFMTVLLGPVALVHHFLRSESASDLATLQVFKGLAVESAFSLREV